MSLLKVIPINREYFFLIKFGKRIGDALNTEYTPLKRPLDTHIPHEVQNNV